jgi:peptide/nickel transport system substrate-binding protein
MANFDRIEWNIIPDSATAAASIGTGEEDWWQTPIADLLPQLRRMKGVKVVPMTAFGSIEIIRFNMLQPPFDNVKMRQAVLKITDQKEYMEAAYGDETSLYKVPVGVFTPGSPAATDIGMAAITGKRDWDGAKQLVKEAGYKGERVVIISPTDYQQLEAFCQVTRDNLTKLGLNVDYQAMDWGTVVQRRAKKDPVADGGWSVFCTGWEGLNTADPGGHYPIIGSGANAWFGWYDSPKMEQLRTDWFNAPDAAAQKKATDAIQELVWQDVPYVPLGQFFQPAAMRDTITGVVDSPFPIFWGAKKG